MSVVLGLPEKVRLGLESGLYERVGGVVRDAKTKQIVMWLREAGSSNLLQIPLLLQVGSVASLLNLGISAASLAVMVYRLGVIEDRLKQVQSALEVVGRRVNLLIDSNFRAALDMAANAFTMVGSEHRHASALIAVNRLLEAQHHYAALTDEHLAQGSQVADEHLLLLFMSYMVEARCYLELEELERARHRLQAGATVLLPRVRLYVTNLLTNNPAVYLQPALKNDIDLHRLTRIYRWLDPETDEIAVFELLREHIFQFNPDSDTWIDALPTSIWDPSIQLPAKDGVRISLLNVRRWLGNTTADAASGIRSVAQGMQDQLDRLSTSLEDYRSKAHQQLRQAMEEMEAMIESYERFIGYQDEIRGMLKNGMSFREWSNLKPQEALPSDQSVIVCLVPTRLVSTAQPA